MWAISSSSASAPSTSSSLLPYTSSVSNNLLRPLVFAYAFLLPLPLLFFFTCLFLICACCCCKCFGDPLALFPKTTASFIFTPKLFLLSSYAFLLSNKSANCSVGGGVSFLHGIGLWSLNGNLMYRKYPIFTRYRKWYAVRPKKCKNATTRNTFKNNRARNFRRSLLCCRSFARGECGYCGFDGVLIIVIIFAFVFVADSFPPGPLVFPLIPASPPLNLFVA